MTASPRPAGPLRQGHRSRPVDTAGEHDHAHRGDNRAVVTSERILCVIDEHPAGWEQLWKRKTHAGPVTDIRVSEARIVSGSMADRTVYIYALADDGSAGAPMALHRTFECEGMTDGVRDDQARSMLESLRDSQERSS